MTETPSASKPQSFFGTPAGLKARKAAGRWLPVTTACAVGVVLSLLAFATARGWENARLSAIFETVSKDRATSIQHHVHSSLEALRGLSGLYAASPSVDRNAFQIYAEQVLSQHPEILGLNWVPRIRNDTRENFESSESGQPGTEIFELIEGNRVRAQKREEYYPVYFLEPLPGNEGALGFDLSTDRARWTAMEKARDSGELVLTGRVRLFPSLSDEFGVLAMMPVYSQTRLATVEARREALRGFVMAVFRMPNMVELSLVGLRPVGINIRVLDETAPGQERLLYPHPLQQATVDAAFSASSSRFTWASTFEVGGRLWTIQTIPTRAFFTLHHTLLPWGVLVIGLLLTGLLTTVLLNAVRRGIQVERLVTQRTAELSEEIGRRRHVEEALRQARDELEQKVALRTAELSQVNTELLESNAQLKHLALQLQSIREEERSGIARELHDELGQTLTGLRMDLGWLAGKLPADADVLRRRLQAMMSLIDRMVRTVQQISASLRPAVLDDFGLPDAIRWQVREFSERTGIHCRTHLALDHLELDRAQATALFRIFQEALTNVARHAQAKQVQVRCVEENGRLVLEVCDDGVGIAADKIRDAQAIGLTGMRERALLLSGHVTISGNPREGTRVRLEMPLAHSLNGGAPV